MKNDTPTWHGFSVSRAEEKILNKRSLDQFVSFLPGGLVSHTLIPIALYFVFRDRADNFLLVIWMSLQIALSLIMVLFIILYKNRKSTHYQPLWMRAFTVHFSLRGILWGSLVYAIPIENHLLIALAVAVLTVFIWAGVVIMAKWPVMFLLHTLPLLLIPGINIIIYWNGQDQLMGWIYLTIFIPVALVFISQTKTSASHLVLEMRNQSLTEKLEKEKQDAETAREQAVKANIAKSRFFAAASHDLRQPLHALGLFSGQLDRPKSEEGKKQLHNEINTSVQALRTMLNSLLDISKLDSNTVEPNITTFSIEEILTSVGSELAILAKNKNISLHVLQSTCCTRTDKTQLERIIRNLLHNAVRYTNQGKIVIGVRRRRHTYDIQVLDSGIGINQEHLNHIFDEFYQIDNPERDREKGVGLGLSIVKRLVDLLDIKLSVQSIPERGSCFTISLPKASCVSSSPTHHVTTGTLAGLIVLVIDDDKTILNGMSSLLDQWGCNTLIAESGDEAQEILDYEGVLPDLIICDYRLRNHELGDKVIANIRQTLGNPVKAILLTGDLKITLDTSNDFAILHKPIGPDQLFQAIITHMAN